jgi:glycosyltransferase involved in cell wall biosynthesis
MTSRFAVPEEIRGRRVTISIVVPACNSREHLAKCLHALGESDFKPLETIVVDDGPEDATPAVAAGFGATVMSMGRRMGPSFARNRGAEVARGDILFFLDSDVVVRTDTLSKIARSFEADADLGAIMGSYDSTPSSPDFISQYRNLMHAYTHQTGAELASTFWRSQLHGTLGSVQDFDPRPCRPSLATLLLDGHIA